MHRPHRVSIWLEAEYDPSITNQIRPELWVIERISGRLLYGDPKEGFADPILARYYSSLKSDGGESLSLEEMTRLADKLEETAVNAHRGEVGGQIQSAKFKGGKVIDFVEPVEAPKPVNLEVAGITSINGGEMIGNVFAFGGRFARPLLIIGAHIEGIDTIRTIVRLDNLIVTKSAFGKCRLTYAGSPLSIFDESNTIDDCTLQLLSGADPASPFITRFRKHYPKVVITSGAVGGP